MFLLFHGIWFNTVVIYFVTQIVSALAIGSPFRVAPVST